MNLLEHVTALQTKAWMTAAAEPYGNFPPLTETSEQQYSLRTLIQRSLPGLPYGTWNLDPLLLARRLRFGVPAGGSLFRGPLDPAVLTAAPTKRAALMDMAYHRWRFLNEASDNRAAEYALSSTSRITVFEVDLRTLCVDLRKAGVDLYNSGVDLFNSGVDLHNATRRQGPPPAHHRSGSPNTRRHRNFFRNTQRIGRLARAANIHALVYACPSDRAGAGGSHGAGNNHGAGGSHDADDEWRVAVLNPDAFWLGEFIFTSEVWCMRVTRRHVEFHPMHEETSVATEQWRLDGPAAARLG